MNSLWWQKMKKTQTCLVASALIFCGLVGYFIIDNHDASTSNQSIDDRLAKLEQERQRQYEVLGERIDRLAATGRVGRTAVAAERLPEGLRASAQDQENMTSQQIEAAKQQAMQRLDDQFKSQVVNSTWSLESTRAIETTLSAEALKSAGALPPAAQDIQCRSSMCRIRLVYPDSESANVPGMMINAAIADRMPYTYALNQPRSDGGVDHVIYATLKELGSTIR